MSANSNIDMQAVILAGGEGKRLAPYTAEIPKPLVTVGDRPVIEILLHRLKKSGVRKSCIAVNHLSHLIIAALGDGSRLGMDLVYSYEEKPLSTVGPLTLIDNLPEHFLVANGDIITDLDFRRMFDYHISSQALVTVATCKRRSYSNYGVLEVDNTGRVTSFREKPSIKYIVSAGIYVFSHAVLEHVPRGVPFGFDDLMTTLLEKDLSIQTFPCEGYWLDIGRLDDYEQANRDHEIIERLLE
ncbi:MAG: sugar phosphate nucleotidyltransferase [candidate division Zixibacteria bacterium]|nr:sugar phosphate nucleotidyltransferase [candidate division Zixibacteria bacterium]